MIGSYSVAILFALSPHSQEDIRTDLVLHYTFDQQVKNLIKNLVSDQHSGKPNQATFIDEKKSGRSLRVRKDDQKSGYVETANNAKFNQDNFTVAAWIKLDRTDTNGTVVCKHDWFEGGARGFVLRCYDGKRLNFTVGAGGWLAANGKTNLPVHEWVHAVGTYDGKNIHVYLNGQLDGTTQTIKPYTPSSYPLRIGHAAFSLDKHRKFDGRIDDVMVWKRTLSAREILAVYKDQKDNRPPPLVAEDISALVKQLGSKRFETRIEAQQELIKLGREVLPLLDSFAKKTDLEIIGRLRQVRTAINSER